MLQRVLLEALRLHKSSCKLLFVMLHLFNALFARGYCRRPDEAEGDGKDQQLEDDVEGTVRFRNARTLILTVC